ncbi:DUF6612 family protein [Bacillus solitudinis]|uniref:DUF6612 family protein n=1 Tax=Bacillus solitudinis TaxID=2014074 RepID=UPI000C2426DB|nr:DUF6612 family protein [Bacillus solitudinis]
MKQWGIPFVVLLLLLLSACNEQQSTEEIYDRAIEETEKLQTVKIQRNQTLRAQQESFRTQLEGFVQYNPLEAFGTMRMTLLNLSEPLEMEVYLNNNKWEIRPKQFGASWQTREREEFEDVIFENPTVYMNLFEPYKEEFLKKEIEIAYMEGTEPEDVNQSENEEEEPRIPAYEISFRGSDEQYRPLVKQHLEQMGLLKHSDLNVDEVMDTVEIERIDMTIFVDKETFQVHRMQTRFRYLVNILGEFRVIDESLLLRFAEHNEAIEFEELIN